MSVIPFSLDNWCIIFTVFPALSEEEQMEWLDIEKAMYHQELTPQGYNKWRWKLFEKAGFLPKADITKEEEEKKPMLKSKGDTGSRENPPEEGKASTEFSSVDQCAEVGWLDYHNGNYSDEKGFLESLRAGTLHQLMIIYIIICDSV